MTPTLIMTRPKAQSQAFADALTARWDGPVNIVLSPLIRIAPVDAAVGPVDAVVLTSVNGVQAAARLLAPNGLQGWCVGTKTAETAEAAGFSVVTGPGDSAGLAAQIIAAAPPGRLAHIRGEHSRGAVAARLTEAGIPCADVVGYRQIAEALTPAARSALAGQAPVITPLFSPRTAQLFCAEGPFEAPISMIALSEAVRAACPLPHLSASVVAARPDAEAMLSATLTILTAFR